MPEFTLVSPSTGFAVRGGRMFSSVVSPDQRCSALAHARDRVLRARELIGNEGNLHEVAFEMRSLRTEVAPVGLSDIAVLARAIECAAEHACESATETALCLPQAAQSLDLLLALVELDSGCR